jgi:hypothetical protein
MFLELVSNNVVSIFRFQGFGFLAFYACLELLSNDVVCISKLCLVSSFCIFHLPNLCFK